MDSSAASINWPSLRRMIALGLVVTLWRNAAEVRRGRRLGSLGSTTSLTSLLRKAGQMGFAKVRMCFVAGLFFGGRSGGPGASI